MFGKYATALPVSSWFALTIPGGGLIYLDSYHLNEVGSRLYGEAAASDIGKRAGRRPANGPMPVGRLPRRFSPLRC